RHITNLFDVKQKAIEVMHDAGIDIIPVVTVVNTVNDAQVGPIFDFLIKNSDRMGGVSFQPVSFTGRDEEISDDDRRRQRYTISHLAHELQRWSGGKIDPYRDWYPLGAMGAFSALADHLRSLQGPEGPSLGSLSCSCHPNCASSFLVVPNRKTDEWSTIPQFFNRDGFMRDIQVICDTARGRELSIAQVALSFMRNYDGRKAPRGFSLNEFIQLFYNGKMGGVLGAKKQEEDWTV